MWAKVNCYSVCFSDTSFAIDINGCVCLSLSVSVFQFQIKSKWYKCVHSCRCETTHIGLHLIKNDYYSWSWDKHWHTHTIAKKRNWHKKLNEQKETFEDMHASNWGELLRYYHHSSKTIRKNTQQIKFQILNRNFGIVLWVNLYAFHSILFIWHKKSIKSKNVFIIQCIGGIFPPQIFQLNPY